MGAGQVFVFILAAVSFALIMVFGYKAIGNFLTQGEKVQFYQFKTDLETAVQRIYSEYGSVRVEQFTLPGSYEQICFVDLDAPYTEEICQFDQIACEVWKDSAGYAGADENVFLKPPAPVTIKVSSVQIERGFLCLPVRQGQFRLVLEGRGDHTFISLP